MELQYKKSLIFIVSIVLLVLLVISKCTTDKYKEKSARLEKNIEALNDTIKYSKNRLGTITASKKALEVTVGELKKQVWVKDEVIVKLTKDYKDLKSVAKIETTVKVPEIKLDYETPIPFEFERFLKVDKEHYSFNIKSNNIGLTLSDLNLENTSYIVIGEKRDGLFKKPYYVTEVTNTNPYFLTKNVEVQIIQEKKPFYNKLWFRMVEIGVAGFAGYKAGK